MKMKQVEKDILTAEKRLTGLETESNQQENDEDVSDTPADEETSKKKNKKNVKWQKQDAKFKSKFNE